MFFVKNKLKVFFFFLSILCFTFINLHTEAFASPNSPPISAKGVILMDAATGDILYEKNMHTAYPPASTTKIMTALLTLENCDLNEYITVGKISVGGDECQIGLQEGEEIKAGDLLRALLVASANDSARVLAAHIGESQEGFAEIMNNRAKELGCENTNFVNAHGMYNKLHKTSAYDLALIMKELVKYPEVREICGIGKIDLEPTNKSKARTLYGHNWLMLKFDKRYYEYAEAGKTGWTAQSNHAYVASAKKDNQRLIAAFLYDANKTYFKDAKSLFEYGFNNFELQKLYTKGEEVVSNKINEKNSIPLLASKDFYYIKQKDSSETPLTNAKDINFTNKTYHIGDYVTDAEISFNNKTYTLKLLSGIDYPSNNSLAALNTFTNENYTDKKPAKSGEFKKILIYTILLLLLFTILARLRHVKHIRRKRRNKNNIFDGRYK